MMSNKHCNNYIVTKEIADIDDRFLFCRGNLATNAIQAFLAACECNTYCDILNLLGKG